MKPHGAGPTLTPLAAPPKPKPAIVMHAPTNGATVTQITPIRDALGRLASLTQPINVITNYTFDVADQVKDIVHASTAGTIDRAHYAYDAAGRRTQVTDHFGAHNYAYDAAGQLTSADTRRSTRRGLRL